MAVVEIEADGVLKYHPSVTAGGSDEFCNLAFRLYPATYFMPSFYSPTGTAILQFNATSGLLVKNVTLVNATDWSITAMAYDDVNALLYAITLVGQDWVVASIEPDTGVTEQVGTVGVDNVQLCEAAFSPATAASPLGRFIFLTSPDSLPAGDAYIVFDVSTRAYNTTDYPTGGLNSISTWTPPGSSGYELLAMSFLDTRPMDLVSLEPISGSSTVLLTLPDDGYVPFQGAQAFAADTSTVWTVLGYNDKSNASYYPVLLEIDVSVSPATMVRHWINESRANDGIWSLYWSAE